MGRIGLFTLSTRAIEDQRLSAAVESALVWPPWRVSRAIPLFCRGSSALRIGGAGQHHDAKASREGCYNTFGAVDACRLRPFVRARQATGGTATQPSSCHTPVARRQATASVFFVASWLFSTTSTWRQTPPLASLNDDMGLTMPDNLPLARCQT